LKSFSWQELTDVDILHESEEGANSLIDALLSQQICALLVQNLERLDEAVKEEAEGVHNTLGKYYSLSKVMQNFVLKSFFFFFFFFLIPLTMPKVVSSTLRTEVICSSVLIFTSLLGVIAQKTELANVFTALITSHKSGRITDPCSFAKLH
jgi:hypothetical protein